MNQGNREKWIHRANLWLLIAFGIVIGLNYWVTFEKQSSTSGMSARLSNTRLN